MMNDMRALKSVIKLLPLVLLLVAVSVPDCYAQSGKTAKRYSTGGKSSIKGNKKPGAVKTSEVKVKEPKAVVMAKREQEKNQEKLKRDYEKSIKVGKKRQYDIQSPAVKERMKQNEKETALRDKEKKKAVRAASKAAKKKYK